VTTLTTLSKDPAPPGVLLQDAPITPPSAGTKLVSTLGWNNLIDLLEGTSTDEIDLTALEVLTANRALFADATGHIVVSAVTDTELGFLSGVTSSIQTQLNGKAATVHTHLLADITDVTITVANLNSLDDGLNSTLHFHDADRARANHTGTQLAATISDFSHALLSAEHNDTLAAAVSRGSVIVGNATPAWSELIIGASGTFLRSNATDAAWTAIAAGDLPSHTHARADITDFAHQATHQSGGSDVLTGLLDATARTSVSKNSAADVGARRTLNFIEGSNVTLTIADDAGGEEVDITIASSGAGSPLTTKGDIFGFSTVDARIPVGANNLVLMADSAETLGVKYALIADANITAHTSTKITINAKGQLNSNIVYTDQINTFGDFVQTFKDNALHLENPAGTFDVVFQTSAEVTSDRILTIPLMGGNRSMVLTGLASQIVIGTEVTGASTALTDTADIAYLNQANTFGAFLNSFVSSSMRIALSAAPTMAVDGDFAIDTTITDFSMGLIKYFDGEEMAVVAMPVAELTTPTDGDAVTYNATTDEFELRAGGGAGLTFARVVKKTDETIDTDTVFSDDAEIKFTPTISKKYGFYFILCFNTETTPDIKVKFTAPSGCTGDYVNTASVTAGTSLNPLSSVTYGVNSTATRISVWFGKFEMSTTAGDIVLQWAQGTSSANPTTVEAGTTLVIWEETA